jgi:general secretion pathway protein K
MNSPHKCEGVALITALLIIALATVAAASFVTQQQLDIRRTGNLINGDQAWAYATAGEGWAKLILRRDQQNDAKDNIFTDDLTEPWAQPLAPDKLPGGHTAVRITDAQARLNLNNLVPDPNAAEITQTGTTTPLQGAANASQGLMETQDTQRGEATLIQLARLLAQLQLNPALADTIVDWVDADLNARGSYGAEDDYYSGLKHPYRTANQPMASISELRLVRGFTEKAYQKILPFVTALPTHTDINVNTAPMEILATLPNMVASGAVNLIKLRQGNPFETIQDFQSALSTVAGVPQGPATAVTGVDVTTQYFDVTVDTRIGYGRASINSLLYRDEQGDIKMIRRAQGGL